MVLIEIWMFEIMGANLEFSHVLPKILFGTHQYKKFVKTGWGGAFNDWNTKKMIFFDSNRHLKVKLDNYFLQVGIAEHYYEENFMSCSSLWALTWIPSSPPLFEIEKEIDPYV